MTGMLASAKNLEEALILLEAGANIIDLKSPDQGALGALPLEDIQAIVDELHGKVPLSATIGDLPMKPELILDAVVNLSKTGVDFIKIGFFPGGDWNGTMKALQPLAKKGVRMVGVLFGDLDPKLFRIQELSEANFSGVMLDTMNKKKGSLYQVCTEKYLQNFITEAKNHHLMVGFSGSLRAKDIPLLLVMQPDYLGFRGALCEKHSRIAELDHEAVLAIRGMIH